MNIYEVISPNRSWTAEQVVRNIVGDALITTNYEDLHAMKSGGPRYLLCRPWGPDGLPIFVGFEDPKSGTIGIKNLSGTTPEDIAEAAHEAFHAKLHEIGQNSHDEKLVNNYTAAWLQQNTKGEFLKKSLERLQHSIDSYAM